jgi:hypothetical protein
VRGDRNVVELRQCRREAVWVRVRGAVVGRAEHGRTLLKRDLLWGVKYGKR